MKGKQIDFIDIKRAYFHSKARMHVFVDLPNEDNEEGMCGELMKAMYGTRDAAQNWEFEYREFLEGIKFERGVAHPCVFYHRNYDLHAVVHGDDFTVLGNEENLNWFRNNIQEQLKSNSEGGWARAPAMISQLGS